MSGIQSAQIQASSRRALGDITIALLAFAASITSVANGFAFDDRPLIELNPSVHSLKHALALFTESYWPANAHAGLYRPLTSLAFAIQWAMGGGSPLVFHVVSILSYVVCCVLAWRLIRRLTSSTAAWTGQWARTDVTELTANGLQMGQRHSIGIGVAPLRP